VTKDTRLDIKAGIISFEENVKGGGYIDDSWWWWQLLRWWKIYIMKRKLLFIWNIWSILDHRSNSAGSF